MNSAHSRSISNQFTASKHSRMLNRQCLAIIAAGLGASLTGSQLSAQGLSYERWDNLPSASLETLRQEGINQRLPDHTEVTTSATTPANIANNYGARLRGLLNIPTTGDYTFFVNGDDNVELWLSPDTAPWHRELLAYHRRSTSPTQWLKYRSQRATPLTLQAGDDHYLEALMKEATGNDHLSIGWHHVEAGQLATTGWSPTDFTFTPQPSTQQTDFTVASGDLWGTNDRGIFRHQSWSGDGIFTIEVDLLNTPHQWTKGGLMLRENLAQDARHAFLTRTGSNGTHLMVRDSVGGSTTRLTSTNTDEWRYLRLERAGDTITAQASADGSSWQTLASHTFSDLAEELHVGFAASSLTNDLNQPLTGWFGPLDARADLSSAPVIAPASTLGTYHWLPVSSSWQPDAEGNVDFVVKSGDIWGTTDRASFHARPWTGDGEFITRLGAIEGNHQWCKAGLMLRAHAGDQARHASLFQSGSNGISFQYREQEQQTAKSKTTSSGATASHSWLRLVREGDTVTAFSSADGELWSQRGAITFDSLPQTLLIGYAASSNTTAEDVSGWFTPLQALPLAPTEIIPGDYLSPHIPDAQLDPLDRGLPDSWLLDHNLDATQRFGENGPYGDPDQDGLDNFTEFQRSLDPTVAAPVVGALTRELWAVISGREIQDLTDHDRFYQTPNALELVPNVDFALGSVGDLPFGARYRGELVAPVTGHYQFWIAGDDHSELWLADGTITPHGESQPRQDRFGKRRIAWIEDQRFDSNSTRRHEFDQYPSQRSQLIFLQAGQSYYFEVLHKEGGGASNVAVAWQTPGNPREIIPAQHFRSHMPSTADLDDDGLPDNWEANNDLNPNENGLNDRNDGQYGDPDQDGLTNLQEYQFGTDPNNADTDGDSLSDYDEIFVYGTDPLVSNQLASVLVAAPNPQQYASATGGWDFNADGSLSARERRGEISYSFMVTEAGLHEILIDGAPIGTLRPVERLPLVISIDGNLVGRAELLSLDGEPGQVRLISPWLVPGTYSLEILHDNYRTARRLRLDGITINRLGGIDTSGDGIPDWVQQREQSRHSLTHVPTTSRTSPVSIEGQTDLLDLLSLSFTHPGDTESTPLAATASVNQEFFADLPLSATGDTTLHASFANGLVEQTTTITWQPTNLFDFDQDELHIRLNDSLLLDAFSAPTADGSAYTITLSDASGNPLSFPDHNGQGIAGQPFVASFETAGTFTLNATHGGQSSTTTLHVHTADLGAPYSVNAYRPRLWSPPQLGSLIQLEADQSLGLVELTSDPDNDPRSFRIATFEAGPRHIIARLPADAEGAPSAILARSTINAFYLAYLSETEDAQIIAQLPDGTWLLSGSLIAVNLPEDILVRLRSFFQGTVFTNGGNQLWLDQSDFNANGIAEIIYEWQGSGDPRACSYVELFLAQDEPQND